MPSRATPAADTVTSAATDEGRLAILLELREGERRVVDLAAMLSLASPPYPGT